MTFVLSVNSFCGSIEKPSGRNKQPTTTKLEEFEGKHNLTDRLRTYRKSSSVAWQRANHPCTDTISTNPHNKLKFPQFVRALKL